MTDARIKKAREIVASNGGGSECTCDVAYSGRGRTDPNCNWCNFGEGCVEDIIKALPEMPTSEDIYLGVSMARVEYNKALDISELDDFHFGFMAGVKWLAKRLGIEE